MNVSFDGSLLDDDTLSENLPPASGLNSNSAVVGELRGVLGSLVKDKSKEHLLDGILRQAYREGLMTTLGFPKRTEWIKNEHSCLVQQWWITCTVSLLFYLFLILLFIYLSFFLTKTFIFTCNRETGTNLLPSKTFRAS
jgi:hypothetical protein